MSLPGEVLEIGGGLTGATAFASAARKSYTVVPQGSVGIRTHRGRALRTRDTYFKNKKIDQPYGKVGAGWHWTLFARDYEIVSTQDRVDALKPFPVDVGEKKQHNVAAEITWGVIDSPEDEIGEYPYRARYGANSDEALVSAVVNTCGATLRKHILHTDNPHSVTGEEIKPRVTDDCGEYLAERYGVELRRLYIIEAAQSLVGALAQDGIDATRHIGALAASANPGGLYLVKPDPAA